MKLLKNRPLKELTTFKIGGPARFLFVPESAKELQDFLKRNTRPFFVLGGGSNVLFSDKGFNGVVIRLNELKRWRVKGNNIVAEAGMPLAKLVNLAAGKGLSGLEALAGIPGTVGGAVKGNAGAWRESIGQVVEFVKILTNEGEDSNPRLRFSYRKSNIKGIIYEVGFKLKKGKPALIKKTIKKYLEQRKERQPVEPSAGSVFINPIAVGKNKFTAGQLIEMAGLKGMRIGGAEVSQKHANFIINRGKATAADVKRLIKKIQKAVKSKFGIKLETEVVSVLS